MRAGLPDVELALHQHERHRQSVARERLRQRHDVGNNARGFEAEELTGAAGADLNVIGDEQDAVACTQLGEATEPLGAGDVDATLGLDRFDDHGGGQFEATALVTEQLLEVGEGVESGEVALVRHKHDVVEGVAGGLAEVLVGRGSERSTTDAVEGTREGDHRGPAGRQASDLERGFHRVGSGGAGELQFVVESARLEDDVLERLEEALFRDRRHVERVRNGVVLDIGEQLLFHDRVVVPVAQGAGATEEVDVFGALFVDHDRSDSSLENDRERPDVSPYFRLDVRKNVQIHVTGLSIAQMSRLSSYRPQPCAPSVHPATRPMPGTRHPKRPPTDGFLRLCR